jgi:hypothetical protein
LHPENANKLMKYFTKIFLLHSFFLLYEAHYFAQSTGKMKKPIIFFTTFSVTGNGISIILTFSLDKPALITNFFLAKGKFSFEPALNFSLEGSQWQFLFCFRYKVINHKNSK